MAFSFNFSGDDIDETVDRDVAESGDVGGADAAGAGTDAAAEQQTQVEVKQHDLRDMLSALPDRLSYSFTTITSPTGKILHLPRRELFDVRVQLMAEDSDDANDAATLADLETSDIRTNVYEGGFKTWECSADLAALLLDRGPRKDIDELVRCDQIIELGAGTALPTLTLFAHALRATLPLSFTLADFNASVLRLVTLPNMLLTWAAYTSDPLIRLPTDPDPTTSTASAHGDLAVTPEVQTQFLACLERHGMALTFLSGPWSPALEPLIPASAPEMGTLVLAAETIYSPVSTAAFLSILLPLLKRVRMAKAVVAAKRVYFGVGGSVDGFKEGCAARGALAAEVENSGVLGMESGVGRALVEVQMF